MSTPGPTVLDALSLAAEVADELVVRSVRDTHLAWADRVHGLVSRATGGAAVVPGLAHRGIASAVYASIGAALHGTSRGLDRAAATGRGPALEEAARGRFVSAAVNGLIGDRLLRERPQLAIRMAVRSGHRDVPPDPAALATAFPAATGNLVVFLHGLCESEDAWTARREGAGPTYGETVEAGGWTPVYLRFNSGLPLRENGVALAALMQRVVDAWPVPVHRVALVGHSLGGLVIRASGDVAAAAPGPGGAPWSDLVSDVVTLGTPHLGAPVARGVGHGARGLAVLPETAAFGRILDWRSRGVHDLVAGLGADVAAWPRARYHLVAAVVTDRAGTVSTALDHVAGDLLGDLLVRPRSAHGTDRRGRRLFPDADVLRVAGTGHLGLLNHPEVHRALRTWLVVRPDAAGPVG